MPEIRWELTEWIDARSSCRHVGNRYQQICYNFLGLYYAGKGATESEKGKDVGSTTHHILITSSRLA